MPITTALSPRYAITSTTATPIASEKPIRNTAPSSAIRPSVIATFWPLRMCVSSGFSTRCAAASALDSVIVMTKPVATKPSRHNTSSLLGQYVSSRSSIDSEPSPRGDSSATRRYIGRAPIRVTATSTSVAIGDNAPAASAAMPGW